MTNVSYQKKAETPLQREISGQHLRFQSTKYGSAGRRKVRREFGILCVREGDSPVPPFGGRENVFAEKRNT